MTNWKEERRRQTALADLYEEVKSLDDATCVAILATMKRYRAHRQAGGAVDEVVLNRWFEEERARVLWPYPE